MGSVKTAIEKNFTVQILKKKLYLPPGYEAVRTVKLENNETVDLHCMIKEVEGTLNFECLTNTAPLIKCSSSKISEAVRVALKELKVTATRRWSGCDFFDLTRSDVYTTANLQRNFILLISFFFLLHYKPIMFIILKVIHFKRNRPET